MNVETFFSILLAGVLGASGAVLVFEIIQRLVSAQESQPNHFQPDMSNLIVVTQARGLGMAAGVACVFLVGTISLPPSSITVMQSRVSAAAVNGVILNTTKE